jgi:hypothetical protein
MDTYSTCTSSTNTSLAPVQQSLFDQESIKSIVKTIAQLQPTRVNPQEQLTNILCSYLDGKCYSRESIHGRLFLSFFGPKGMPSAIFNAYGSDVIENYRHESRYSNVNHRRSPQCPIVTFDTFLELFENRSQAGYRNIYFTIVRSAEKILNDVLKRYDLPPAVKGKQSRKRNTSGGRAPQSMIVKYL